MNYVVRCEAPKAGANPQPKPEILRVWSSVKSEWVLRDATREAVLEFLAAKAAERETSFRLKELRQVQARLAEDPERAVDSYPVIDWSFSTSSGPQSPKARRKRVSSTKA